MRRWDLTSWEAALRGGTVQREVEGVLYKDINRPLLQSFRLINAGEIIMESFVPDGATGNNLCYRRRTAISHGGAWRTVYMVAWVPMGPVIVVDPSAETYRMQAGFVDGDPDFQRPQIHPHEGENFSLTSVAHTVDVILGSRDVMAPAFSRRTTPYVRG
jgi:hypothetical protein